MKRPCRDCSGLTCKRILKIFVVNLKKIFTDFDGAEVVLAAAGVQPPELAQVAVVIRDIIDAAPEGAWTSRSRYYVDIR